MNGHVHYFPLLFAYMLIGTGLYLYLTGITCYKLGLARSLFIIIGWPLGILCYRVYAILYIVVRRLFYHIASGLARLAVWGLDQPVYYPAVRLLKILLYVKKRVGLPRPPYKFGVNSNEN